MQHTYSHMDHIPVYGIKNIKKEKLNGISQIKYKTSASAENHDGEQKQ